MSKKKTAKKHAGLPQGMTYADKLKRERMLREAVQKAANDAHVEIAADIRCQRQLWLMCVAMNEAFGIGPKRFRRFGGTLTEIAKEYARLADENDADYANEQLRRRAEQITGLKIEYLYEAEMREAERRAAKREDTPPSGG